VSDVGKSRRMGLLALNRQPNEPPRCPCLRRRCPTWRPELQEGLTWRSLRGQSGVTLANRPNPACRTVHASIPGTHTHISQSVLHQARFPCQCLGSARCAHNVSHPPRIFRRATSRARVGALAHVASPSPARRKERRPRRRHPPNLSHRHCLHDLV
jgi:hypothetical protein